jgi:hypothetical protein
MGVEVRVTLPEEGGDALLERLREFGDSISESLGVAAVEWWSGAGADEVLYFRARMPDGVYFEARVAPMMVMELLTDGPLDDFLEHMERELAMRVDEWKRGMHQPAAPDLTEHVIAFRQWKIDWSAMALGSTGIGGAPWQAATWQMAECRGTGRLGRAPFGHGAPHPDCGCGLYGLHELPDAPDYGNTEQPYLVWGVIQVKGRMEVHRRGVRAEYARPVMLLLDDVASYYVPYDAQDPTRGGRLVPRGLYGKLGDTERAGACPVHPVSDEAITALGRRLGLDVVRWDFALTKAGEYGKVVPPNLRP